MNKILDKMINRLKTEFAERLKPIAVAKKLKPIAIAAIFAMASFSLQAQLTIDSCYSKAMRNYPLVRQYNLINESLSLNIENASQTYIPQLSLTGRATWQSDITKFPDEFTAILAGMGIDGISFPDNDQYRLVLELSQTIWDGGAASVQKKNAIASSAVDLQSLEVNLYSLKNRVNQLFFGILLIDEQLKLNGLLIDELDRNYNKIKAFKENGVANQADLNAIMAEKLVREQSASEMRASREAYITMLSLFIGEKLPNETQLQKPPQIVASEEVTRPELKLFSAQKELISQQESMLKVKSMPRVGLFAQGAYANPGLNMFTSGFTPYFIGGIQFSWNIGSLYSSGDDRRLIAVGKNSIDTQESVFLFNTQQNLVRENSELKKYRELLETDEEIIALRGEIKEASAKKLENGILGVNDFLRDLLAEDMAKQTKMVHETQLLLTMYQLKVETGE